MEKKEYKRLEMIAYEEFIRRASTINLPFMLKGSYVSRQYFQNRYDRTPADLDWVYMDAIDDEVYAREKFNEWATLVTELPTTNTVKYRSFKENEFWRLIEYAMAEDFPTVNTDLKCWVNEQEFDFGIDISFNLDIEQPPVSLLYKPIIGEPFLIQHTVPLSLQVSWKIHQTLVRPRFKDLFDLIHLLQHPTFDKITLEKSLQALINECSADQIDLIRLNYFLNKDIAKLFPNDSINESWDYWRHNINTKNYTGSLFYFDRAEDITDISTLPYVLQDFLNQLYQAMQNVGFDNELLNNLPTANRQKRKAYNNTIINKIVEVTEVNSVTPDNSSSGILNFIKKLFS